MKKILSVILSFVMIIACVPSVVFAADTSDVKSLYWYNKSNGEVKITKYIGSETDVDIPSEIEGLPVTAIGKNAFYKCVFIENVFIPGSVEEIGKEAFYGCYSLKRIDISDGVKNIGEKAFYECTSIEHVFIPGSVEEIGKEAFYGCDSLKRIDISDGVKTIGDSAFYVQTSQYVAFLPESIKYIGKLALTSTVYYFGSYSQWDNITINDGYVDEDEYNAYLYSEELTYCWRRTGIDGVTEDGIVYSVTEDSEICIRGWLPEVYGEDETIVVPETLNGLPVTSIGDFAFENLKVKNLYIHKNIKDMGYYTFYDDFYYSGTEWMEYSPASNIETVYYEGSLGRFHEIGAIFVYGNGTPFFDLVCDNTEVEGFALIGGQNCVSIRSGESFEPVYEVYPENASSVFKYSNYNNCITIKNGVITGQKAGETTVTVTAESGVKYTFTVKVIGAVGISVMNPPNKTYYGLRESFDAEGLKIIKQYNDGTFVEVTAYKLSSFNPLQRGIQIITVTGEGFTTSFNVFVSSATVGDIDLDECITSIDSNLIKRIIAGIKTVEEYTDEYFASDVNGDGEINAIDSALLKQKIAG